MKIKKFKKERLSKDREGLTYTVIRSVREWKPCENKMKTPAGS